MQKRIALVIILSMFYAMGMANIAHAKDPLNQPIKQLYSAPSEDSDKVFEIPIEVMLLDMSDDGDWYKVRIAYSIGPFNFSYVGWTKIPFADILAKKSEAELASF